MKVISVNVGLPREVQWKGETITTGIFKDPVAGPIKVHRLNLLGDLQADLSVHGGPNKAVYGYPWEHYDFWRRELPEQELPWGMFGENLTTSGLLEESVNIGDRLRVGSAELVVVQPRVPCYKLQIRFGREDIIKRFLASGRSGMYFAVVQEGEVAAGDPIELIEPDPHQVTVADINRLYAGDRDDLGLLQQAVAVAALPENVRRNFRKRIAGLADPAN